MIRFKRRIVVDMTPLQPRGQNGGAGLVATSLVRHLSELDPELHFTLLTADDSHAELGLLDAANVERKCVTHRQRSTSLARRLSENLLPARARVSVKRAYGWLLASRQRSGVTAELQPDLLVCPFTVPYFWRAGVRCISIVYDLQHVAYPVFFTPEQRMNRTRHIEEACARSDYVVCISDYVRKSLRASVDVPPQRAIAIPLGLLREPVPADASILNRLDVAGGEFLLYPANFWPHKNHERLFEALRSFRKAHPASRLRLVCPGAPSDRMHSLAGQAPAELVVFSGYVTDSELAALYEGCAALIFPSLYEGFGMPVLEAMAHGKPVLCSNVTSLPEVAGDAAVYFDPTDPDAIAQAIESLDDPSAITELVARGRSRVALLGNARDMARRYLELVHGALGEPYSRSAATSRPAS